MPKNAQKVTYNFNYSQMELGSLIETRVLHENDDVLAPLFQKQQPMGEEIMKKGEQDIIAEPKEKPVVNETTTQKITPKIEEAETRTYTFSYVNPETEKIEVLTTTSEIKIKDKIQMEIEEAVGSKSTLGIYSFIASPLIMKQVDQIALENILKNMEYDTPPKFGGGQLVVAQQKKTSEVVPISEKEKIRDALVVAVTRKEEVEKKLEDEIIVLEEAVKQLNRKNPIDGILAKLPPLTRARFEILLRRKNVSTQILSVLLRKDAAFLKAVKGKLQGMGRKELISLVKSLKELIKG